MLVTRQSIQLHGGIGYTDEYDAGLYLRRVMVLANSFGSSRLHRARFAGAVAGGLTMTDMLIEDRQGRPPPY